MAQNSTTTARRGPGRPFKPGQSGNPGGRPKGFAAYIRQETAGGIELIRVVLGILRDEKASATVRQDAATWLADRGFGKPKQTTEIISGPERRLDLSKLTDEQLDQLEYLTSLAAPTEDEATDE